MNREEFAKIFEDAATPIWERIRGYCSNHPAVPTIAVALVAAFVVGYCAHG